MKKRNTPAAGIVTGQETVTPQQQANLDKLIKETTALALQADEAANRAGRRVNSRTGGDRVERSKRSLKHTAKLEQAVVRQFAADRPTSRRQGSRGIKQMVNLMGSREEQEIEWLMSVTDCEQFAARLPTSEVSGIVPVDLYRTTCYADPGNLSCNAAGVCYAACTTDGWHSDGSASPGGGLLHANGSSPSVATVTNGNRVANTSPPATTLLATGEFTVAVPNVSPDFVSDPNDGTEYIMVAQRFTVSCDKPPNAAPDAHFIGKASIFQTIDPERDSLQGQTVAALRALAGQEGSNVYHAEFLITESGRFVPIGFGVDPSPNMEGYSEISAVSLPLDNQSYEWRRIGEITLSAGNSTVNNCNVLFVIESAYLTTFNFRATILWQTEEYATSKVHAGHNQLASRSKSIRFNPASSVESKLMTALEHRMNPSYLSPPKKGHKAHPPPISKPSSTNRHAKGMLQRLGKPKYAIQAAVAVVSDRMTIPGVHASLVQGASLGNIITGQPVVDIVKKYADKADDYITDRISKDEESGSGFWSQAWDFVKSIAPSLLELGGLLLL